MRLMFKKEKVLYLLFDRELNSSIVERERRNLFNHSELRGSNLTTGDQLLQLSIARNNNILHVTLAMWDLSPLCKWLTMSAHTPM
jgi:hypothetical protein